MVSFSFLPKNRKRAKQWGEALVKMHCSSAGRLLSTFCSKSIGETNFGAMACYFVHELCDNDSRHSGNTVIRGKTLCFGARDWSVAIPCQHVFCTESRQVDFYYIFSYQDPTSLRFEDSIKAAPPPPPSPLHSLRMRARCKPPFALTLSKKVCYGVFPDDISSASGCGRKESFDR